MGYCLNCLDEPVFMAGPKPMQTEFGIHIGELWPASMGKSRSDAPCLYLHMLACIVYIFRLRNEYDHLSFLVSPYT